LPMQRFFAGQIIKQTPFSFHAVQQINLVQIPKDLPEI